MVTISSLWLAILLSGVAVFFVSSLVWMVLPHHKSDFRKVKDEEALRRALGEQGLQPGQYSLPHAAGAQEMASEEYKQKVREGPVALIVALPNKLPDMGRNLTLWFVYTLYVGLFVAYLAGRSLPPGAGFGDVFQLAGAAAVLGYATAVLPGAIWVGRPWRVVLKEFLDGVAYGACTGLVFALTWPAP